MPSAVCTVADVLLCVVSLSHVILVCDSSVSCTVSYCSITDQCTTISVAVLCHAVQMWCDIICRRKERRVTGMIVHEGLMLGTKVLFHLCRCSPVI